MSAGAMERLWRLPGLRAWRARRGLAYYVSPKGYGLHWGHFATFEEGRRWLPASPEFDHERFSDEYLASRINTVYGFDYPMMLWLGHAFRSGARRIFDFGGSVGVHYYSYRRYLDYPSDLEWHVCELPASAKRGREHASAVGAEGLRFSEQFEPEKINADIWITAGTIEFVELGLDNMIAQCAVRPGHVLVNKLPLHDGDDFVSTQNIGQGGFAPHAVFNRKRYIERVERLGYRLADAWKVPERSFTVPGAPGSSFPTYSGLYFQRA